jgi:hypothetical protein
VVSARNKVDAREAGQKAERDMSQNFFWISFGILKAGF